MTRARTRRENDGVYPPRDSGGGKQSKSREQSSVRAISRLTISGARHRLLRHTNARTRTGTATRRRSVSRSLPRHKCPSIARQERQLHLPPKPAQRYPSPARISPPVMANASGLRPSDDAETSAPSSRE